MTRARGALLYNELSAWWPLLSPPADYRADAAFYIRVLRESATPQARTVLELGCGGGNNASHMKKSFRMTLVDLSPGMLAHSRRLNPECEHRRGDMRTLRLGRTFDAVFVHDAINYMVTPRMLRQAVRTAWLHCRPGGCALFAPDWTRERFRTSTVCEGAENGKRSLRYLEWTLDPDPDDHQYTLVMSFLLRSGTRLRQLAPDVHRCGLFSETEWMETLAAEGFRPRRIPFPQSAFPRGAHLVFAGRKPA
ncbi:MAG TPA: class I SAM-dependent methyltransferase [bacterium]|nr:class I SAM-dependent methyltransferase [bacterium]